MSVQLRAAVPADLQALAALWHQAWQDAHAEHVPESLLPHRELPHFEALAISQLALLTVAVEGERVVGFVGVDEDELERLFVARNARGTGVADALIAHGECELAKRHARAYLVVLEANARARRFYARHGWADAGPFAEQAPIPGGSIELSSRRYEKQLRASFPR